MKNWIINKMIDWITKNMKQEMNKQFGAPNGSIVFLYAAHDPRKPPPNVWVVTHPYLNDNEVFRAKGKELADWIREELPAEVWDDL